MVLILLKFYHFVLGTNPRPNSLCHFWNAGVSRKYCMPFLAWNRWPTNSRNNPRWFRHEEPKNENKQLRSSRYRKRDEKRNNYKDVKHDLNGYVYRGLLWTIGHRISRLKYFWTSSINFSLSSQYYLNQLNCLERINFLIQLTNQQLYWF